MKIYSKDGQELFDVLITKAAESEQELMKSDFVKLQWNDVQNEEIPVDAYIQPYPNYIDTMTGEPVKYSLLEPYNPTQKSEAEWNYEPSFHNPKMRLGKVTFKKTSYDTEHNPITLLDWSYSGFIGTLLQYFCDAINETFGLTGANVVTYEIIQPQRGTDSQGNPIYATIENVVTATFATQDILSALSNIANVEKCEWHLDWKNKKLYFGFITLNQSGLEPFELVVGDNVQVPSAVRDSKEGYWNAFEPQGSTRNLSRRAASGENVQATIRLALNTEDYLDGVMYTDGSGNVITKAEFIQRGLTPFIKSLIFDNVYPKLNLYVYDVRYREYYLTEDGEKVIDGYDSQGKPIYKRAAIWYMRLAYPVYDQYGNVTEWRDYKVKNEVFAYVDRKVEEGTNHYSLYLDMDYVEGMFENKHSEGKKTAHNVVLRCNGVDVKAVALKDSKEKVWCYLYTTRDTAAHIKAFAAQVSQGSLITFVQSNNGDGIKPEYAPSANVTSQIIDGKELMGAFQPNTIAGAESCPLAGRGDGDEGYYGFQLNFHEEGKVIEPSEGDTGVVVKAGDYEIVYQQNGNYILPTTKSEGIIPKGVKVGGEEVTDLNQLTNKNDGLKGNIVNLYNIVMDSTAEGIAQNELENETKKYIFSQFEDNNSYTVKSNPIAFEEMFREDPMYNRDSHLYIGQQVKLVNGDYEQVTRVMKVVSKLDFDFEQEITVGNKVIKGPQTTLKEQVETIISGGANGGSGGAVTEAQIRSILQAWVTPRFLSKLNDDTAQGLIRFIKGFIVGSGYSIDSNGEAVLKRIVLESLQSSNYVSGLTGWNIDKNGNMEAETLHLRSALEVDELRINRQQAQEGDTIYAENDQIESVEEQYDEAQDITTYVLTLKEKWEGYFTAQQYGNILRGKINTLAAKDAGVSDYTGQEYQASQQEDEGGNKYYTSFMQTIATHNTDPNLGVNQIRVVLFGDSEVPMAKNYPPCALMAIARWGCIDYSAEYEGTPKYNDVVRSIKRRQQSFMVLSSEGRIVKLNGVDSPILRNGNFGTSLGILPDFVQNYPTVHERMIAGRDYLYAQGVVVGDFIKIDVEGNPIPTVVDKGEWQTNTPYYYNKFNETTQQYETHRVRHNGGTWQCLQSQPVISGGVATYYEPKWNSPYWMLVDGNDNLTIEFVSTNGSAFYQGYVNTVITPHLFYGNVDISSEVDIQYWSWTRETESGKTDADRNWDSRHTGVKVLNLANEDMPTAWGRGNKAIFTCTVVINDGKSNVIVQNQVIA